MDQLHGRFTRFLFEQITEVAWRNKELVGQEGHIGQAVFCQLTLINFLFI